MDATESSFMNLRRFVEELDANVIDWLLLEQQQQLYVQQWIEYLWIYPSL